MHLNNSIKIILVHIHILGFWKGSIWQVSSILRAYLLPNFKIFYSFRAASFFLFRWQSLCPAPPVWPDWAIYWTLGNFSKLLALINLSRSPTFLGNFCKGVKIFYFFLVKSFLGNFIDIWRLFTGHTDCTQPRHKDDKLNIWNFFVHLILFKAQFTRSGFHASVWQDRNVSKHKHFHFSVNGAIWKQ